MIEEHLIQVHIAETGPRHYQLNPQDVLELIREKSSPGAWIYADDQLIQAEQVNEENLSTVSSVRILPALVGGLTMSPHVGDEE